MGFISLQITVIIDGENEGLYNLYFHNCYDAEPDKIDMKVSSWYSLAALFHSYARTANLLCLSKKLKDKIRETGRVQCFSVHCHQNQDIIVVIYI